VVIELSQQVLAGTIEPDDALRRLVVAPLSAFLTGHPGLTGNRAIDAVFTNGVRQPVFDALVDNLPAPVGQADGLIDTIDAVTEVATDIPNTVGPSAPQSSVAVAGGDAQTTDEADTETSPAPVQPEDPGENLIGDTKAPRLNRPPSVGPGRLVDRLTKTINDFGNTITNLTGSGGQKPGQDAGSSGGSAGVSTGKAGSSADGTGSSADGTGSSPASAGSSPGN
jgi:hypothetical protein